MSSVQDNASHDHEANETEEQNEEVQQSDQSESIKSGDDDTTNESIAETDSINDNTNTKGSAGEGDTAVTNKVTNFMTENSSDASEWKSALSGSLDETRMLFGLVILALFYVVYINVSAHQNNKSKDEYAITHNCSCRDDHRYFYVTWSAFCVSLWVLVHVILTIPQINNYPCLQIPGRKIFQWKTLHCSLPCGCFHRNKGKQAIESVDNKSTNQISSSQSNLVDLETMENTESDTANYITSCYSNFKMSCSKLKRTLYQHDTIHRYEYYLWTKYYELYVVGITKQDEKFSLETIDKFIDNMLCTRDTTDGHNKKPPNSAKENKPSIYNTALSHIKNGCCSYGVQATLHLFLFLVLFLAQLAVIPLLMIQVFDTYAFLCLAADNYCTMENQFTLHFHQTAVTFAFYCCLMVSFLASTMLRWIPWPTKQMSEQKIM